MNNKETLQQYNDRLETNNNNLDSIMEIVNSLPEAGGGSEDLTEEITDQNDSLTTQEITIQNIISVLDKKIGNGKYAPRHMSFYSYPGTEAELIEDLAKLDTSNITSTRGMFNACFNINKLSLNNFNTSNVTNMNGMFYYCKYLTELDLSSFDTSNVTNMNGMFRNSESLTKIDMRNFDFTKVTDYTNMFTGVYTHCLIIVKDDAAKTWITSKFTTLTNVKTVVELEEEYE